MLETDHLGSVQAVVFNTVHDDGKYESTKKVTIRFELYNKPLSIPSIEFLALLKGPRGGYSTQQFTLNLRDFYLISEGITRAVAAYAKYVEERLNNQIIDEILTGEEGTIATG